VGCGPSAKKRKLDDASPDPSTEEPPAKQQQTDQGRENSLPPPTQSKLEDATQPPPPRSFDVPTALEKICKAITNPKKQIKSFDLLTQLVQAELSEAHAVQFWEALQSMISLGLIDEQLLANTTTREACVALFAAVQAKIPVFAPKQQVRSRLRPVTPPARSF